MGRKRTKPTQETPFGQKLLSLRESHSLSKESLSEQVGLSKTYIDMLERGQRKPSRKAVLQLAQTLAPAEQDTCDHLLMLAGYRPEHNTALLPEAALNNHYEQALDQNPNDFQLFTNWILSLMKAGEASKAGQKVQEAMSQFQKPVHMQTLLALLAWSQGRTADAIATQELALQLLKKTSSKAAKANVYLNLGSMTFGLALETLTKEAEPGLKQLNTACAYLAQAQTLAPNDLYIQDEYARALFNRAGVQESLDKAPNWEDVIAAYRAVLAQGHSTPLGTKERKEASLFLALSFAKAGQGSQAQLCLDLVSPFYGQDWLFHYVSASVASLAYSRENALLESALTHLKTALDNPHPDNRTASEAPVDPDFENLRQHKPSAFEALFNQKKESKS